MFLMGIDNDTIMQNYESWPTVELCNRKIIFGRNSFVLIYSAIFSHYIKMFIRTINS